VHYPATHLAILKQGGFQPFRFHRTSQIWSSSYDGPPS